MGICLDIKNLSVSYDEPVIKGVNLSVYDGEILCIVGESGSGKTTLLQKIVGIGSYTVDEGEIFFQGKNILNLSSARMNEILGLEIGYIQQNPAGAFNPIRRFERQFRETFLSNGLKMDCDKIRKVFHVLGLKDTDRILKSRPYEMSGGMKQRIAIASSMVLEPGLLLCDEITSALDVSTTDLVCEELKKLNETLGTTIVMVTHSMGVAASLADRIVIMKEGQIVESGLKEEIFSNPKAEYTKQLLKDMPRLVVK